MNQEITISCNNGIFYPDPLGAGKATLSISHIDGCTLITIGWAGAMRGVVTKDMNNFLVSIRVLDEMSDSPELRQSLENIGHAV